MDKWDLMRHWSFLLPPSRPSAAQLRSIKNQIRRVDRSLPVAVLGSTPEFRDLLWECGFRKVYLFERNQRFFKAMSKMRVYGNPEEVVVGDWIRTLEHYEGYFGVILSDLTSGNVDYKDRALFYELISRALVHSGLFLDKVLTHVGACLSVDTLVEKYADLPMNLLYVNHYSCEMLFCSELLDLDEVVDTSRFYGILDRRIKNTRVRLFTENTKTITPPGFLWYYGRRWERLEPEYCPTLSVVASSEDETGSPYYGRLRFFVLAKEP